jgi:hypothetical protein
MAGEERRREEFVGWANCESARGCSRSGRGG